MLEATVCLGFETPFLNTQKDVYTTRTNRSWRIVRFSKDNRPCHGFPRHLDDGKQKREKLQCLYENLMSNNFRKTAVLTKNINCKLKLQSKGLSKKIWGAYLCLNFSRGLL